jgi:hypothetical protein
MPRMDKFSHVQIPLVSLALFLIVGCGGSDPVTRREIRDAAFQSGVDESNPLANDPNRTDEGLKLTIVGPASLDVRETTTINVRLANYSDRYRA